MINYSKCNCVLYFFVFVWHYAINDKKKQYYETLKKSTACNTYKLIACTRPLTKNPRGFSIGFVFTKLSA
jgi:hypothetical protein